MSSVLSVAVFIAAAFLAVGVAYGVLAAVETISKTVVDRAFLLEGEEWAEVETSGLQVIISGEAPSESARFRALSIAGHEVDASRVIDNILVPPPEEVTPPRFSIEMLRNEAGISMIGLIPFATDRLALGERVQEIDASGQVTDLLETADYPMPERWDAALELALFALDTLPRSKISIDADRVAVEAIADSAEQKTEWEQALRTHAPGGVRLVLDISAPRPVITPFTLRFTIDEDGARFDACTAHTEAGLAKIVAAGVDAGVTGQPDCTIGLGVPSPDWPDAAARGIRALKELGGGSLTFSDADVTLVAAENTPQAVFDRVVGELETDLPEVFSLHSVLPEPVSISGTGEGADGPPEFVATLSPEGLVQLRGRVASEQERTITESVARARFGVDNVYAAMRVDPELPRGWSVRTLAALEALDQLANGVVVVQPLVVDIRGATGDKNASAEISRVLSEKLGESEDFRVSVRYEEKFDPIAALPTPQECADAVNAVMAESKITFAPGSAEIEASSARTIDEIAEILKGCPDVAMEIAGYTDSQGREEMNQALSQRRADSVLSALLARRVLTSNLTAHGYGEENPIADNDTEEGREANRRIEFRLVGFEEDEAGDEAAALEETGEDAEGEASAAADETVETPEAAEDAAPAEDTMTEEEPVAAEEDEATAEPDADAVETEEPAAEEGAATETETTVEEDGEADLEESPESTFEDIRPKPRPE